jgi:hypothetical protein
MESLWVGAFNYFSITAVPALYHTLSSQSGCAGLLILHLLWTAFFSVWWNDVISQSTVAVVLISTGFCVKYWIESNYVWQNVCWLVWFIIVHYNSGAHDGAVGWGTVLQTVRSWVRFPMIPLEFFIDIIPPVALWRWGWLSL